MKNSLITFTTIFIFVLAAGAFAQAPSTMPYQGRLADDVGNAITGAVNDVVFTIYDDTTSGANALWTETDTLNCDENGVFTIELGLEVPIDPMIFNGEKRWLGIKVGTDDEMVPRQLLSSVPYSFNSALMPGVAQVLSGTGSTFINFATTSPAAVDSITINAPGPGFVLVTAQASLWFHHVTGSYSQALFHLSQTPADLTSTDYGYCYMFYDSGIPTGSILPNMNIFRIFQVASPGPQKYYLNASTSSVNHEYYDLQLYALFIPSSYGPVELPVTKKASSQAGGLNDKLPGE